MCNLSHIRNVILKYLLHKYLGMKFKISIALSGWIPWSLLKFDWVVKLWLKEYLHVLYQKRTKLTYSGIGDKSVVLLCSYFLLLSTEILVMGGWLNSFLLFNNALLFLLDILTASFACLYMGSWNLFVS